MEKIENKRINTQVGNRFFGIRGSICLVNYLNLFTRRYYSDSSKLVTSNLVIYLKHECKEKKEEIHKKGFPAVFQYMSKMKEDNYFAITKLLARPLDLGSLKEVPGIYMITNKVHKKFYIWFYFL